MVDRTHSLIGSQVMSDNIDRNINVNQIYNTNMEMIKRANNRAAKMREYISKYKRDVSLQSNQFINKFKQQQKQYARDRNYLKGEVQRLEDNNKQETSQYLFIKKQLIKAVKCELDLQFELNQEITARKQQIQKMKQDLYKGSNRIQNAVADIEAKKQQILYIQKLINDCLQLLQIIGVLVHENGQKINEISQRVRDANKNIELAQKNIDKARLNMQKSRSLIIIVLGVIIYFTSFR